MATRQVKDAIDLNTGEKIYFKSHASATYLSDGKSLETAINDGTIVNIETLTEKTSEFLRYTDITEEIEDLEEGILATKQDIITDLDEIRAGAAKGATALQSYTEKFTGAITGITMNGESVGTNGIIDLGDIATQEDLDNKSDKITVVNHGTANTTFTLNPNILYVWDTVSSLNLSLNTNVDTSEYNEYMFQFTSGDTATSLALPDTIQWVIEPSVESNYTYQCSIVNNIGVIVSVTNE